MVCGHSRHLCGCLEARDRRGLSGDRAVPASSRRRSRLHGALAGLSLGNQGNSSPRVTGKWGPQGGRRSPALPRGCPGSLPDKPLAASSWALERRGLDGGDVLSFGRSGL